MTAGGRLFISAGEVSGEHHAALVVREILERRPDLQIDSMGGRHLEAAGTRLLFPLSDFAVLGFAGVFKNLSRFIGVLRRFAEYLDRERPDAVVLVDYPGLHLRFAHLAKRRGIPVVYFVCPQLWAWAPWRARRFAGSVDRALTILPFEAEYLRRKGVEATFVGHPTADQLATLVGDARTPPQSGDDWNIAILPGSRPQEAQANLPLMIEVARRIRDQHPSVRFILPQLREDTREVCRGILERHPDIEIALERDVTPVLTGARFALVASGTATFEVAWHGVPMVVIYRITPMQRFLGRQLLTVPWISQVNLIAGREVVPEFVTTEQPAGEVTAAALPLIRDGEERQACLEALTVTLAEAFRPGAAARTADEILALL